MNQFKLSEDVVLCENAIFLTKSKSLVISDLQLGYEQQLRALGHNITYEQAKSMFELLESTISQTGTKQLIINGDLKHEFGKISSQERKDIIELLGKLKRRVRVIAVKGNHDTLTKPLLDELGIPLYDEFAIDKFLCIHGHAMPKESNEFKNAHTIIIGHIHPAITLNDGVRKERYKCFLKGEYNKKRIIVLPSFSTIVEGTDILHNTAGFSPLLDDLRSFEVYIIAEKIMPFGKIGALRKVLEKMR